MCIKREAMIEMRHRMEQRREKEGSFSWSLSVEVEATFVFGLLVCKIR